MVFLKFDDNFAPLIYFFLERGKTFVVVVMPCLSVTCVFKIYLFVCYVFIISVSTIIQISVVLDSGFRVKSLVILLNYMFPLLHEYVQHVYGYF